MGHGWSNTNPAVAGWKRDLNDTVKESYEHRGIWFFWFFAFIVIAIVLSYVIFRVRHRTKCHMDEESYMDIESNYHLGVEGEKVNEKVQE
jgi:hypothetical protein